MGRFSPSRSNQEGRQQASGSNHSTGSHQHRGPRHHTGKAHHSGTYHMTGGHHHTGAYHHTGTYVHHGRSYHSGSIHCSGSEEAAVHATGSVLVSGSVRGHEIHFVHGATDLGQSSVKYLPMGYGVAEGAAATFPVRFLCPTSGSWKRTIIRSAGAAGSSTLRLYRSQDGTANPSIFREHVTVNMAATNHTYSFNTSGSLHFHEGDVIAFSFDPASNPGATNFTHIFELYTRIDIPS